MVAEAIASCNERWWRREEASRRRLRVAEEGCGERQRDVDGDGNSDRARTAEPEKCWEYRVPRAASSSRYGQIGSRRHGIFGTR